MGRQYKCKYCGVTHDPPTGKHCPERLRHEAEEEQAPVEPQPSMAEMQQKMEAMERWMQQMKDSAMVNASPVSTPSSNASVASTPHVAASPQTEGAVGGRRYDDDQASPETLRRDRALMREASRTLARLRLDDYDDGEEQGPLGTRMSGKKSGAVMTAADRVVKHIDWPHFYVHRGAGANRQAIKFRELRIDEFVFGFMCMIEAPHCTLDYRRMTSIMRNMMQDSVEFSWETSRNFYEVVGNEIEKGVMRWTDEEAIREKRMTYARTIFPMVKAPEVRDNQRPPLQTAPAGMKCCAPFQKHECESTRDHQSFTHACAYCFKAKNALCRHPEADCFRKNSDASKNGRPRE